MSFQEEYEKLERKSLDNEFENNTDDFKQQVPNIGFQTASGKNIDVSKEALKKGKLLFAKENETTQEKLLDAEFENEKIDYFEPLVKNIGFESKNRQTANISNNSFRNSNTLSHKECQNYVKQLKTIGFQTASGKNIKVSIQALQKGKLLFTKETETTEGKLLDVEFGNKKTDDFELQDPNIGFQTASGKNIKVSKEALQKGKLLFTKELETPEAKLLNSKFENEKIDNFKPLVQNVKFESENKQTANISNNPLGSSNILHQKECQNYLKQPKAIEFQTASGNTIKVSNHALKKAKSLFTEETEKIEGKVFNAEFRNEKTDDFHTRISNIGFQSASGKNIKVSNKALKKAKSLFIEETEEIEGKALNAEFGNRKIDHIESQDTGIGFQTASGQNIDISRKALGKANILFQEDFENSIEQPRNVALKITCGQKSSQALTKNKRKNTDLDNFASLNKQEVVNNFKKLRYSHEFQDTKPVVDNEITSKNKENKKISSISAYAKKDCDFIKLNTGTNNNAEIAKDRDIIDNSLISYEIAASTIALLADERASNTSQLWQSSPERSDSNITNVLSSPVLGRRYIPRKRKSVNKKNEFLDISSKKNCLSCTDNLQKENYNDENVDKFIRENNKCSLEKEKPVDTSKLSSPIIEYGDTQLMLDFINHSAMILHKRLQAASEQDKQIALKQRNKPKPLIGALYFHKESNAHNRISWRVISKGHKPVPCTYEEIIKRKLPPDILDINANNAETYKFRCSDFYEQEIIQNNVDGIKAGDGAHIILDENGFIGIAEIKRSFLASPGIDPNLLPVGWIENHYKWIVWKLASMDRIKLHSVALPRALSPHWVMKQLKYRYDREIDKSQRSALRKILEKDDVPSKRIVLCVSSIVQHDDIPVVSENSNRLKPTCKKLILTDGWYCIQATIDQAMIKYIMSNKIKEGTKLLTYGSELLNCEQGYPPLEVPENVSLKIHTNSTRRARWDIKLGYTVPTGPLCVTLRNICPNGGLVGKIKVLISRVYPLLYCEKISAGESIFRNARCEEKANLAYEQKCRSMIESFYAKVEKYLCNGSRANKANADSIDLAAYEWNEDCEKLFQQEFLSEEEIQQLRNDCYMKEEKLRQKLESQLNKKLPAPRQVTSILKIRIVDNETSAILSIWSPSEEVIDIMKEGNYLSITNIMPACKRNNEIQLTASRNTVFRQLNAPNINYPRRTYTALSDIDVATFTPSYGEFDTVGIVTSIQKDPFSMKNFEAVHLASPLMDTKSSFLCVLFWQGICSYGYTEILTVGSFVACKNLEWRHAFSNTIPVAYCTDRSIFTCNPRENYLQQPFIELKHSIKNVNTYVSTCAVETLEEIKNKSVASTSYANSHAKISSEKFNIDRPINNCSQLCVENQTENSLLSNQPAKSAAIQKRLEKLQCYGEPPSLSPIVLNNGSKRASSKFHSPLRSMNNRF